MLTKIIIARANEGKTRELFSEMILSKGNVLIVSKEQSRQDIEHLLSMCNYDTTRVYIGEISSTEILKNKIRTVLFDYTPKIQELKFLESLGILKTVYTVQQNALNYGIADE